jgi:hypothetical protein
MSPLEKWVVSRGTDGSNPVPSSGESCANHGLRATFCIGCVARREKRFMPWRTITGDDFRKKLSA